jgi:hypothetical protein
MISDVWFADLVAANMRHADFGKPLIAGLAFEHRDRTGAADYRASRQDHAYRPNSRNRPAGNWLQDAPICWPAIVARRFLAPAR